MHIAHMGPCEDHISLSGNKRSPPQGHQIRTSQVPNLTLPLIESYIYGYYLITKLGALMEQKITDPIAHTPFLLKGGDSKVTKKP